MPGHQKAGEKRTHQSRSGPYKEQSDAQKIHVVVRTKPSRQFDSSPLTSLSTLYPPVNADSRALAGRLNYNSKGQQAQGTLRMAASLRTKGLQWRSAAAPLPALPSCSTAKEHTDLPKWSSTSQHSRSVSASGAARAEPSVRHELGRPAALSSWDATEELEAWAHDPSLKPSTQVVASRARQLSHGLRRLRPSQLAAVARALASMGHHPGEDWLSELDAVCYSHPGPFDPASSTALVHALAQLHKASQQPQQQQHHHQHQLAHTSHPHRRERQRPHRNGPRPHHSSASSTVSTTTTTAHPSPTAHTAEPAPFRFPQAVYLRLSNPGSQSSGTASYSYEQLAVLLQSFRSLGMEVGDDVALAIGARMAAQLMDMGPERRAAALQAVVGGAA